jgi:hypothetical protein
MENKDKLDMSYVAGLMDGDGSFSISKGKPDAVSPLYKPLIQLGSLHSELVKWLKEKFRGIIVCSPGKICEDGIKRRDFYRWRIEGRERCKKFIENICIYLKVKKGRAEFLLDYILGNPFKRSPVPLSKDICNVRESSYIKMKEFNDSRSYYNLITRKNARYMSEDLIFWSYLAGLIDTDGSLSIRKNKAQGDDKNYRYSSFIQLGMNDVRGLNFIKENCPYGRFKILKARTCVTGFTNKWIVQNRENIKEILLKIIPFLKVKKEQAEILLFFCKNYKPVQHRQSSIPKEELEFRENCYKKLINENKYGVYKPSLIDLEAHDVGDRAEDESHGERLSERDARNGICDSLNSDNK